MVLQERIELSTGARSPPKGASGASEGAEKLKRRFRSVRECIGEAQAFEPNSLVEGLLDLNSTSIFFAPSNEGKTFSASEAPSEL